MDEECIRAIRAHSDGPISRDESYKQYSESKIRYLKNLGLLDCYFDYSTGKDMIFTTDSGRRYLQAYDNNRTLGKLKEYIDSGRELKGEEYRKVLKAAAEIKY